MNITNSIISGNIAQGSATATGPGGDCRGGGIEIQFQRHLDGDGQPGVEQHRHRRSWRRGRHTGTPVPAAGFAFGGGIDTSVHIDRDAGRLHHRRQCRAGQCGHQRQCGRRRHWRWPGRRRHIPERHNDVSQTTVIDCTIIWQPGRGRCGRAGANGGDGLGGGLAITSSATATLTDSSVVHNAALGGEAGHHGSDGQGVGGGVYVFSGGTFTPDITTFIIFNFASTSNDDLCP